MANFTLIGSQFSGSYSRVFTVIVPFNDKNQRFGIKATSPAKTAEKRSRISSPLPLQC